MRARDLPAVMEIDAASLPRPWRERIWREELETSFGTYLVLEDENGVAGHIGVKHVADDLHITTLAVSPQRRRRGYARALVEAALAAFPHARRAHLEVRPSNTAARALYDSVGFVVTGLRRRYYGDEDALLMTLDL